MQKENARVGCEITDCTPSVGVRSEPGCSSPFYLPTSKCSKGIRQFFWCINLLGELLRRCGRFFFQPSSPAPSPFGTLWNPFGALGSLCFGPSRIATPRASLQVRSISSLNPSSCDRSCERSISSPNPFSCAERAAQLGRRRRRHRHCGGT